MRDRRLADLGGGVRVVDVAIALLVFAIALLIGFWPADLGPTAAADRPPPALPWVLLGVALETLPVAWRRAAPLPALAVSTVAGLGTTLAGITGPELGAYHLLFMVAVQARRGITTAAMALFLLARIATFAAIGNYSVVALDVSVCLLAFTIGRWLQSREAEVARLRERDRLLGIDAEDRARAILADERARLARELHDGIAQSMVIIAAQSSTAARTLRDDPADAEQALAEMQAVGREGVVELRRLLGVLRDDGGDPAAPSDRLARLDALVARYRAAGLPVQLTVTGDVRPLPAPVDLSGYRLVQEALTNALKHAGPARATVLLDYCADALRIQVVDDGRGGPFAEGHGLHGMRERALLLGGTLVAGPRPEGGFAVRARLPLPA